MKREIKCRGIKDDMSNPCWLYGTLHIRKDSFGTVYTIEYEVGEYIYEQSSVTPLSIGQFTGLYDKKGKEIYEGDIVLMDYAPTYIPHKRIVEWRGCGFCTYRKTNDIRTQFEILPLTVGNDSEIEVIGNIHEPNNQTP